MGEVHCVWILALITLHSRLLFELLHDFVAVVALQREKCADVVGAFLSVRTCALARFSSEFSVTAIEQGRDGGSFSLRETRFIGRWAVWLVGVPRRHGLACQSVEEIAEWRGVVASTIYSLYRTVFVYTMCTMMMLVQQFCIERILNAYYNTGNKSMRGSFDPPTQVTIKHFMYRSPIYY